MDWIGNNWEAIIGVLGALGVLGWFKKYGIVGTIVRKLFGVIDKGEENALNQWCFKLGKKVSAYGCKKLGKRLWNNRIEAQGQKIVNNCVKWFMKGLDSDD